MKRLLFIFLLIPSISFAQRAEILLSVGADLNPEFISGSSLSIYGLKANLSATANFWKFQVGGGVELGPETFGDGFIMPYAVANYKFNLRKLYFYTGLMAGWVRYQNSLKFNTPIFTEFNSNGFNAGVQAGGVVKLGRHFGLNVELGFRRATIWYHKELQERLKQYGYPVSYVDNYLSALVGVRYRF